LDFPLAKSLPFESVKVVVEDDTPATLNIRPGIFVSDTHKFTLPPGEKRVTVTLHNPSNSDVSNVNVYLHWQLNDYAINLHIMTVGVSCYAKPKGFTDLIAPSKDARQLRKAFLNLEGQLFDRVMAAEPLIDCEATRANIIDKLEAFVRQVRADRTRYKLAVVCLSGHGKKSIDESDHRFFVFMPHDYDSDLGSTHLYWDELKPRLERLGCPVLVILDSCYSGRAVQQLLSRGEPEDYVKNFPVAGGLMVLAAAHPDKEAFENNQGLLTNAILEVLNGTAQNVPGDSRVISLKDLEEYARRRVGELARKSGKEQKPLLGADPRILPDNIPIALRPIR
jgi:hypothetical protein